ncbi:MAG: hypothetical protein LAO56_01935, partial [Acidobacteriia bacterium]|nr:hypothetical protein [Terriglobia bacterium]
SAPIPCRRLQAHRHRPTPERQAQYLRRRTSPILRAICQSSSSVARTFFRYKDWYFIYDPTSDRGGTINSPWCPGQINQGFGTNPMPSPAGAPSPPNTGAPGTVSPTPNQPNPEGDLPVQQ